VEVREIGDRRTEGEILGMMGATYSRLGDDEKALACFQRAVAIPHELGDARKEADELSGFAKVLMNLGRMDEAEHALSRAESLLRPDSDPLIRVKYLAARAVLEFHRGDLEAAHATLAEAGAVAEKYGSVEVNQIIESAREAMRT
jgi:tetratricopeptide (TPR) repeat protein